MSKVSRKREQNRSGRRAGAARRRVWPTRWLLLGAVAVALVAAVALAVSQGSGGTALAAERHALGDAKAPVTVLEWADFQ